MQITDIIKKRKVILSYKIAYLLLFLGILYGSVSAFYFNTTIALIPFSASFISIVSLFLLRKGALFLARILISVSPIIMTSIFHAVFVQYDSASINSLYISQFGMTLIPWVLFDYEEKKPLFICVLVGFVVLIFQSKLNAYIPLLSEEGNPFSGSFIDYLTYLTATVVIFTCLYFFLGEQNKYEKENYDLLKDVIEKNEEIMAQNEELNEAHQQITEINTGLEKQVKKRTEKLEQHNKLLAEYAFINAHLLRAPLCRIIGLTYLLKRSDSDSEKTKLYHYLDKTIGEMQYLTRRITVLLDRGGYYDRYDLNYDNKKEAIQESTIQMDKSRKKRKKAFRKESRH